MYETLKSKLNSWSLAKLTEAAQYLPITPLGGRAAGFSEQGINELYIINKYRVDYFNDDGTIATLVDVKAARPINNDFDIIKSLPLNIRIARPVDRIIDAQFQYTLYSSPDTLGIPFVADYFSNHLEFKDSYIINFIDQVAEIIKSLTMFPDKFIGLENRLKDSQDYYFYNINNFNSSATDFIAMQLEYLQIIIDNPIFDLSNKDYLLSYARSQWQ